MNTPKIRPANPVLMESVVSALGTAEMDFKQFLKYIKAE